MNNIDWTEREPHGWRIIAASMLFILAAAACAGNDDSMSTDDGTDSSATSPGPTQAGTPEPSGEPIRIGAPTGLTGGAAQAGEDAQRGFELAVEHVNAAGGVLGRPLELDVRDTETTPDVAQTAAQDLVDSGVDLLLGPLATGPALAVAPIAEAASIPICQYSGNSGRITIEDFQPYLVSLVVTADMEPAGVAQIVAEEEEFESIAMVGADYDGGHTNVESFTAQINELRPDVEVIHESFPALGEQDYSTFINAIAAEDPDVVYSILFGADLATFTTQAAEVGFFDDTLFVGLFDVAALEALGETAPEGQRAFDRGPFFAMDNERAEAYVDEFREAYDALPAFYGIRAYDCIMMFAEAVERAGTLDGDAVMDEIVGKTFDTLTGPVHIRDIDHQGDVPLYYGTLGDFDSDLGIRTWSETTKIEGADLLPSVEEVEARRNG